MALSLVALVGMKHRGTEALVDALPQGEPLTLIREADNRFDRFAVQVWARGVHVGFIKSAQVRPIAIAMDSNSLTTRDARLAIDGGKWPMVEIDE